MESRPILSANLPNMGENTAINKAGMVRISFARKSELGTLENTAAIFGSDAAIVALDITVRLLASKSVNFIQFFNFPQLVIK